MWENSASGSVGGSSCVIPVLPAVVNAWLGLRRTVQYVGNKRATTQRRCHTHHRLSSRDGIKSFLKAMWQTVLVSKNILFVVARRDVGPIGGRIDFGCLLFTSVLNSSRFPSIRRATVHKCMQMQKQFFPSLLQQIGDRRGPITFKGVS